MLYMHCSVAMQQLEGAGMCATYMTTAYNGRTCGGLTVSAGTAPEDTLADTGTVHQHKAGLE